MKRLLISILLICPPGTAGAQIELNPPKPASVIKVDVNLVNVFASVRDRHGAYVKDLRKEDFEIWRDGKRQAITHFAREVDSPLTVALLLDVSGSVVPILGAEKAAAGRFLDEVLRPGDQALLVGFAQLIAVWQDLTPSKERLHGALERAGPGSFPIGPEYHAHGGTVLYDAVNLAAAQTLQQLPGRKAMIVITDGLDTGSLASIAEAVKAARRADSVVYGIHYVDEQSDSMRGEGFAALEKLSEPTGGRAFHVDRKMPLETVFARIAEEMRHQYGLGFTPSAGDPVNQFHKLQVKCVRAGLKVQARTGYYSQPR